MERGPGCKADAPDAPSPCLRSSEAFGNTIEEMRESLMEFFASKDRDWYRRGIHQLEEQLQKVIESGGEYFE